MSNDKELYELGDSSPARLFLTEEELKTHRIVACNFSPQLYDINWDSVGLEEMKVILKVCLHVKIAEGSPQYDELRHVLIPCKN